MAIYRNIQMSFWTDSKIIDDFSPEERYFYLYLMTNPHTNLAGCYEISMKHMSDETGYNRDKIEKLLSKLMQNHKVISYSKNTKEVLLVKWHKYNWTSSEKFRKPLLNEIENVKNPDFKGYLTDLYNGIDTVSIPYPYGSDTTVTVSDIYINNINNNIQESLTEDIEGMKEEKHKHGQFGHVFLSDRDIELLYKNHGEQETKAAIDFLDAYIEEKGYKSKNHKMTLDRWVFDAVNKNSRASPASKATIHNFQERDYDFDDLERRFAKN